MRIVLIAFVLAGSAQNPKPEAKPSPLNSFQSTGSAITVDAKHK